MNPDGPLNPATENASTPLAPTDLVALSATAGAIDLSWRVPEAVDGYNVYRNGSLRARVYSVGFRDEKIAPGKRYDYSVSAFNRGGAESARSASITAVAGDPSTLDVNAPTAPGFVTARGFNGGNLVVWKNGSDDRGVSGYNVYRNGVYIGTAFSLAWIDRDAEAGADSAYRIVAFDLAHNFSHRSMTATVDGNVPVELSVMLADTDNAEGDEEFGVHQMFVNQSASAVVVLGGGELRAVWSEDGRPMAVRVPLMTTGAPLTLYALSGSQDAPGDAVMQFMPGADSSQGDAPVLRQATDGSLELSAGR